MPRVATTEATLRARQRTVATVLARWAKAPRIPSVTERGRKRRPIVRPRLRSAVGGADTSAATVGRRATRHTATVVVETTQARTMSATRAMRIGESDGVSEAP